MAAMTLDHVTAQQESLADHAVLLAEGALVLSALATAGTPMHRAEELADLRAIHAEAADLGQETRAASDLAQIFDAMVRTGTDLSRQSQTAPAMQSRIKHVLQLTRCLAAALDEPFAPGALEQLNAALRALDPLCGPALDLDSAVALAAEVTVRAL